MSERGSIFADKARIHVSAGAGGNGAVSFRREKYVPHGGPDGGNGGPGGDVVFVADPRVHSLADFINQVHWRAKNGGHGSSKDKSGKKAPHLTVKVPVGTVVWDVESGDALADLDEPGATYTAAHGGKGGRGNAAFATSVQQTPRFAEKGDAGEERWLLLELKLLADVGLIGLPNAGKSTLLAAMTAATPKIGDYPFTTLTPNLGVARWDDERPFVVADLPGLIEGASAGAGRGTEFLRHIERTRVVAHVIDAAQEDPLTAFDIVNRELVEYREAFAQLPQVVVLNKLDLPAAVEQAPGLRAALVDRGYPVFATSGLTGEGIEPLLEELARRVSADRATRPKVSIPTVARRREEPMHVAKIDEHTFRVTGPGVERMVARTDLDSDQAVARIQGSFERMGVVGQLRALGAQPGDKVLIGPYEFDYTE